MGKYNLYGLGWKGFENLCGCIMQHVLGPTYTPFSEGADGGRDGYFEGNGVSTLIKDKCLSGKFIFQCKHTSKNNQSFNLSIVKKEYEKVKRLVETIGAQHYIIFTNYNVSGINEAIIREKFLEIPGLESCIVLGQDWFDLTIDINPIVRRLVPRLYGIGDLSQIIDERILNQSKQVLDELQVNAKTFVSTQAYQNALIALENYGFVILLGAPAVGKTSIATNICMTARAEGELEDVLILESAEQFTTFWNTEGPKKLYWFDDVFGSTSLDYGALINWTKTFLKLSTAIKAGTKVIFTSRDYIFNEAIQQVKKSAFPLIFNSKVVINVEDLTLEEKEQILYNQVKSGNLPVCTKKKLKHFLKDAAIHSNFTPELARRLGDQMFHQNLDISHNGIRRFMNKPIEFFKDTIYPLDKLHKATLVLILLHNNQLKSPIKRECLLENFVDSYGLELHEIKKSLEYMRGSLVKYSTYQGVSAWSLYHPTMIDSLLSILSDNPEMIEIFILGASFRILLRDTTCLGDKEHKLFIAETSWDILVRRILDTDLNGDDKELLTRYIVDQTDDQFVIWLHQHYELILEQLIFPVYFQLDYGSCFKLASRLNRLNLLKEHSKMNLISRITEIARGSCDMRFMKDENIKQIMGSKKTENLFMDFYENGIDYFEKELEALENNYTREHDADSYFSDWFSNLDIFEDLLDDRKLLSDEYYDKIEELRGESEEITYDYRERYESPNEIRYSSESHISMGYENIDIFSDVDE
ncbi:hypothetical protein bcgnr5416_15760 [Bacillus cereus]|uniref:nSTAND3 domain-containing NTPase n=1 Tax=Bacillus cereus TaxID=1396 RepID=UPI001F3E6C78|nr:hypothetical protein [Bacillus cereus]BCC75194.1 hypothetical protein BCJMU62_0885 [Bacillus cereus]HDX9662746.1 hypothetical protein [Bacillus cereus]